ncbi:TVP38/TMEM64 family protein [Nitrospirillum iridis]|uniref:TVP38/TMEM64 family membrane protein n=1 Tax=Nitrospirillum iridis TaxID=765888 RepID=A0A7X0AZZ9_9PROT|nr:VTT domain-containing protein [Nitrospirillum iridis]MBB6251634.1 putative membrane protein YdjX (TVP38/TMEM64 family) [Nitrospirillum iridis]
MPVSGAARRRLVVGAALLLPLLAVFGAMLARRPEMLAGLPGQLAALPAWVRAAGATGWLTMVLLQVLVAASGVLPAALIGLAAGAAYGVALGFPLAALSLMIGALLTFALGRSLFRPWVARLLPGRPRLAALDGLVAGDGWRLVCLLRLSPVMPFAVTSYALGLSSVTLPAYVIGTLASLPALLGYVVAGQVAGAAVQGWGDGGTPWRLAVLVLGAIATLGVTLRLGQLARRAGLLGRPFPDSPHGV